MHKQLQVWNLPAVVMMYLTMTIWWSCMISIINTAALFTTCSKEEQLGFCRMKVSEVWKCITDYQQSLVTVSFVAKCVQVE